MLYGGSSPVWTEIYLIISRPALWWACYLYTKNAEYINIGDKFINVDLKASQGNSNIKENLTLDNSLTDPILRNNSSLHDHSLVINTSLAEY